MLGNVGDHRFGDDNSAGRGPGLKNRTPGCQVGLLDLDDHPSEKPGHQLIGQPGDQPGMLVGRQDNRRPLVDRGH